MGALGKITNPIQDSKNRRAVYDGLRLEPPRTLEVDVTLVSAAKSVYVLCPWTGIITKIYACFTATTVGPVVDVFSFAIQSTSIGNTLSDVTGTVAGTGSISLNCTGGSNGRLNKISAGDIFTVTCDGGSTGPTMTARVTAVVQLD